MGLRIDKDTVLCMSLSARPGNFGTRFQNHLYESLGLNFVYKAFTTNDIRAAVGGIRALGIRGCAVSMPFKERCMEFLDELDESARSVQSVNTIVNTNGRLKGYNTDFLAVRELLRGCGSLAELPFALYGSGGMAKAVACALSDLGAREGVVVARNEKAGRALAGRYGYRWATAPDPGARLLVNASPLGMRGGAGESLLPFSEEWIAAADCVFDVVAIPPETPFVRRARDLQKRAITGSDVIVLQALEQFVLYTGMRPAPGLVEEAAAIALSS